MRAIVVEETGGPQALTLVDRPTPEPGPGQALVDVAAAGVNFIDTYQRSGAYPLPTPFVLGSEGAGTVRSLGPGTSGLSVGDRVAWAMAPGTGYTEQTVVDADRLVVVPVEVELETAAAVMLQGLTAHYLARTTFPAGPGHTALVTAAAGGVGLLLTQLLHRAGVRVIGTVGSPDKAELATQAGADEVILYRETDLLDAVRRVTGDDGVHVVYDGVGQDTFETGLELLRPRGMMVLFGAASGPVPPIDPQVLNQKGSLFLTRPTLAHYVADRAELTARADDILHLIANGELDVRVSGRYPLADARRAHEDLEGGGTTGKLILVP
ncbi:NADPH:quinone reductase [Serinicoccus sp. CNJ-927]|uniref:quinone oxidoreductase family protein n=1 Tax=unclassified Serinicoccus TaxID=2643101 RepID=UPI00096201B6|nr:MULTISPECIES: quinone oxidoreductase [unclassified Serinicoccus]OLT14766.1 NADPH:quinone reductase [Serinicoccus sp. CUA-874]OLT39831.1 NADPH:quinone reductase [Serinicoccus sp. CNJ-927]